MADKLIRGILGDGLARMFAIDITGIAEQTRQLHTLRGDAAQLAAEAVVAAVVLSGHIKGEERVSLQLQCSRPKAAFIADVDASGGIRARFTPEVVTLDQEGGIEGMMLAIKSMPGRELYRGVTPIENESISDALTRHLGVSAQVDTILNISAVLDDDGAVIHAGGIVIERLPVPEINELEASAEFVVAFDPVREMGIQELLQAVTHKSLQGVAIEILEEQAVNWRCSCGQERVEAVLLSLPVEEITAILKEDGKAEVICHFCNIAYQIGPERLEQMVVTKTPEDVN
jgi:molecular chaperone Hsp33